jgi:hypothetical protein
MYAADLQELIEQHQLTPYGYADDTQVYGSWGPADAGGLAQKMSICIDEVSLWMKANRSQLNQPKTEVVWFASSRRQHQITSDPVRVGGTYVLPASTARDLGVHLDSDISMRKHINMTVRACFTALRRIRTLRRSLPRHALLQARSWPGGSGGPDPPVLFRVTLLNCANPLSLYGGGLYRHSLVNDIGTTCSGRTAVQSSPLVAFVAGVRCSMNPSR